MRNYREEEKQKLLKSLSRVSGDVGSLDDIVDEFTSVDPLQKAYYYVRDKLRTRWPEVEPYIMRDPNWAFRYAFHVIKGRWPEAEPYIKLGGDKWRYYKELWLK